MRLRSFASSARAALALVLTTVLAAACGGSVLVEKPTCEPGLTECDGQCVDTSTDPENCGGCGTSCFGGGCVNGGCTTSPGCAPSQIDCSGTCVDPAYDPNHCGGCGIVCPTGVCDLGTCVTPSCYCGDLCKFIDVGSDVPHSVDLPTGGFPDQWVPSCVSGSGEDIVFHFVAPIDGVYSFDTKGTTLSPVLEILDVGCGSFACTSGGPDGVAYLELKMFGGQEALVVVDTQDQLGDVQINIAYVSGGVCATCSDVLTTGELNEGFCPGSEELYNQVIDCICLEACAMACESACNGQELTPACEDCISDPVEGCGKSVEVCLNDL